MHHIIIHHLATDLEAKSDIDQNHKIGIPSNLNKNTVGASSIFNLTGYRTLTVKGSHMCSITNQSNMKYNTLQWEIALLMCIYNIYFVPTDQR
mmetsp:Transcript_18716/g.33569  ORF Transcript_18716/g.33569 Transcript_18716/m.33569 type:complete len:93 (+) Transcript_18716:75-353(+)